MSGSPTNNKKRRVSDVNGEIPSQAAIATEGKIPHETTLIFRSLADGKDTISYATFAEAIDETGLIVEELGIKRPSNEEMTLENFAELISVNHSIICNALRGKLVIPKFKELSQQFDRMAEEAKKNTGGENAHYIPDLKGMDSNLFSVCFRSIDNQSFRHGDHSQMFAIQSISKTVTYMLALQENGIDTVHRFVGREPSGREFNGLALNSDHVPHNPYINAGAIVCASLVKPNMVVEERLSHIMDTWRKLTGPHPVRFNENMYRGEKNTADRNFCLGYMMQENKTFQLGSRRDLPPRKWRQNSLLETFDLYFMQCSIETTADGLALAAATLANAGINPMTKKRVFSADIVSNALSLMYSCGMYDYSGEWNFKVGLPSKSGVSGTLLVPVPGVGGFGVFSPRLDRIGNTVSGVHFIEEACKKYRFHHLESMMPAAGKVDVTQKNVPSSGEGLIKAASLGDFNEVRYLLADGMDVNFADYDRRTPLMLAASNGKDKMVEWLLCHGADTELTDRWGNKAIDDAKREGFEKVVAILAKTSK